MKDKPDSKQGIDEGSEHDTSEEGEIENEEENLRKLSQAVHDPMVNSAREWENRPDGQQRDKGKDEESPDTSKSKTARSKWWDEW